MKKGGIRNNTLLLIVTLFSLFTLITKCVLAFDGASHEYVTKRSLKIVKKLGDDHKNFYNHSAKKLIMEYCTKPDEDEIEGLYKNHFYNIATGRNFMGEKMSALEKLKRHYENAVISYKSGRVEESWEELGRAIHFLEDLFTPVHGGYTCPVDAVSKLSMHINFEKKCVQIQKECVVEMEEGELKYFLDNTIEEIGKMCARFSNDNFFALEKEYVEDYEIAINSVANAQKAVAGLLYRFYSEINRIK